MIEYYKTDYLSLLQWGGYFLFLIIIIFLANTRKKKYIDSDYVNYYLPNVYFKLGLATVYALYYIVIVGGGDTIAYWEGTVCLNNLFWESPIKYFNAIFSSHNLNDLYLYFNANTGIPPGWIYREPESWFVTKLLSVVSLLTFKNYIAGTLILAYISSIASWKLFQLVHSFGLHSNRNIAIATLFVPSICFWCSGISKDTIILFLAIFVIFHGFQIIRLDQKATLKNWILLIVFSILIYNIRSFMLATIFLPMILSYSVRLVKKYRENNFVLYSIRFIMVALGILFFVLQGESISKSEQLEEAAQINKDFVTNTTYEGQRYDIGLSDFSAQGMIKAFPMAVIAGIYRPFPWEATSLTLILNGIEDAYLIYLTLIFLFQNGLNGINQIRKEEFLMFSLIFVILMAFMAGATSGLFGVLVRFKAPVLSFALILLTINKYSENNEKT